MNSDLITKGGFEQELLQWLNTNDNDLNEGMREVR